MMNARTWTFSTILAVLVIALFAGNILMGSVRIPAIDVWHIMCGQPCAKPTWAFIVLQSRLPQAITALLCGAALAGTGLMLQTTFQNPLAGPSILGIDTGSSLGVALVMLVHSGSLAIHANDTYGIMLGIVIGAFAGALVVMGILLMLSNVIRSNTMLLIAGIMTGYIASSAISLLNFFASADGIHAYTIWGLGNFSGVTMQQMPFFATLILVGLTLCLLLVKPLNALLLGRDYATNLGINVQRTRNLLLLATGLLTATATAFCGPIAFIGLAVPHIARLMLGTSHHNILMPITLLAGSVFALLCNLLCILVPTWGMTSGTMLPLNAITPLIGAPVIIYVIINQRKLQYFN